MPREQLFQFLSTIPSEPFEIAPQVDSRRFLSRAFPPELPLLLKQYSFPNYRRMMRGQWAHWHDYYELILPVSGRGRFQVGDQTVDFVPGDLLVVDNLKLHGISELSGPHRSLVIFFPARAIAPPGSNIYDHAFLAPLCGRPEDVPPLFRRDSPLASQVHVSVLGLAKAWFGKGRVLDRYVACKVHLLTLLALLREHFGLGQDFVDQLRDRQQRQERLQSVLEFLAAHCTEPISQSGAAAVAGMSTSRFREFFKRTTGSRFVDYVRELRLSKAAQMLRENGASIGEVAAAAGFSDQSYLNRCFKAHYGVGPLEYRRRGGQAAFPESLEALVPSVS